MIANPQPDLPAQVTIANAGVGGSPMTKVVQPGASLAVSWAGAAPSGSSQAARALFVTSSVPVYIWLNEPNAMVALLPEHALSTSYLAGLGAGSNQLLAAVATVDGTQLTATVTSQIAAGAGVAATSAGGTLQATLDRGDVLTLSSAGSLDGSRLQATSPIAVILASPSGALALPGADTLGREVIVPEPALVIARDAATVTTELEGTLTLAAGRRGHARGERADLLDRADPGHRSGWAVGRARGAAARRAAADHQFSRLVERKSHDGVDGRTAAAHRLGRRLELSAFGERRLRGRLL